MSFIELFLIAVGLSMDAFAVSISDGMVISRRRKGILAAALFGLFQAGMPVLGYFLGAGFAEIIGQYDHYIALVVLGFIGGKMIFESIKELKNAKKAKSAGQDTVCPSTKEPGVASLLLQAVATSIDALVVGVSFAAIGVEIAPAAAFIGIVTFAISLVGFFGGRKFGELFGTKAELVGGAVLVGIGVKTFVQHMFF